MTENLHTYPVPLTPCSFCGQAEDLSAHVLHTRLRIDGNYTTSEFTICDECQDRRTLRELITEADRLDDEAWEAAQS